MNALLLLSGLNVYNKFCSLLKMALPKASSQEVFFMESLVSKKLEDRCTVSKLLEWFSYCRPEVHLVVLPYNSK